MAIDNISSVFAQGTQAADRRSLGKDEFLMLLVTQLKNQDPLSPLQPHEFAAQLAQFTSVEQLQTMNAGMLRQEESLAMSTLLSKTSFSAGLLGRQVVAAGDQVVVPSSGPAHVRIEVGGAGGRATLKLLDASGHEVATRELGSLPPGRQTLALPQDLPPGTYRYQITIKGAGDKDAPVTTFTTGVVDGISFANGRITLRIGDLEFALDDLAEIEPAVPAAATGGGGAALPGVVKDPEVPRMPPNGPPPPDFARRPLGLG